jgi:hypothetical protein
MQSLLRHEAIGKGDRGGHRRQWQKCATTPEPEKVATASFATAGGESLRLAAAAAKKEIVLRRIGKGSL